VKEQPTNQTASESSVKNILKNKKQISLILGVVIAFVLGTGIAFYSGIQIGKREASQAINTKIGEFLNPLNALATNPIFPNSVVGKVTNVNGKSITVKLIDGKSETITIDSATLITRQTKTLTAGDIKKDANVTVFTSKAKNKEIPVASRIIVRS